MNQVNWGMIGCGQVTETKSGPGLYKSENSSLEGVYGRVYERAVDYIHRHQLKKAYRTVDELLADPKVNAVYIATPPKFHKDYALACLRAGKIPYVEKPLALTLKECLEIKALSERLDIPVYVAFYRRGLDKFIKIKELLAQNSIGQVRYIYVAQTMRVEESELDKKNLPWRVVPEISGGGKFLDMGVHVLDCLIWYFGEMEFINGIVENRGHYYDADDTIIANFKFKNGLIGSGTWCYVADKNINEVQIVGDRGRIIYDGLSATCFYLEKDGVQEIFNFIDPEHVAMPYQQAIVNEMIGKVNSFANFNDAINLAAMTDSLLSQYYKR